MTGKAVVEGIYSHENVFFFKVAKYCVIYLTIFFSVASLQANK